MLPATAMACRGPFSETHLLHASLPPAHDPVIAAEVEIVAEYQHSPRAPIRARVLRALRGDFAAKEMLIDPQIISSCDRFPVLGERGIAVGPHT